MVSRRPLWLVAPAVIASAVASPAAAEVYLNEAQALAAVFGEHATVRREQKALDALTRTMLEQDTHLEFPEAPITFYVNDHGGQAGGYAVVISEIGKSEPITFMVAMTPEGKVADVVVMEFRENRGWEVKEKRFLNQFHGKTIRSSIRVNEDIINYTGATLSSKALARGVKRALFLFDTFYPKNLRGQLQPGGQWVKPYSVLPLVTAEDSQGPIALYRQRRLRMGTVCEIRAWSRSSSNAQQAFVAGFDEIERIEQIFSAYREGSELFFVNREAADRPVSVSEEFFELTRYAVESWEQSRGAFDITVGPLTSLWGLRGEGSIMPSEEALRDARRLVGSDKLRLRRQDRTIHFDHQGMILDFGGLAKGHAAERAARIARNGGVIAALVNLGDSSLAASGGIPPDGSWAVSIADPADAQRCAACLNLKPGECLSTSGTYRQQVQIEGNLYSHLLDPRTGRPLDGLRSLTAISSSGRQSEVLSKYLLTLSEKERATIDRPESFSRWTHLEGAADELPERKNHRTNAESRGDLLLQNA